MELVSTKYAQLTDSNTQNTQVAAPLQDQSFRQSLNYAVKVSDTSQSITQTDRPLNTSYRYRCR